VLRIRHKYRIEGVLGRGSSGVVYRGNDTALDRAVAIKLMHGSVATDVAKRDRFLHECRAMAALDHRGIARIYEADVHHDQLYLAQQLIDGERLKAAGHFDSDSALKLADELLSALGHAHAAGVSHRDVNPNNVLLVERDGARLPVLIDFGLARTEDQDATKVAWGGTPRFAAPEQILDPQSNDHRSDLFAVAAVLYSLLAKGHVPYEQVLPVDIGSRPREMLRAYDDIASGGVPLVPIDQRSTDAPPYVVAALARALAPAPGERFQNAQDMAAALKTATADSTSASVSQNETSASEAKGAPADAPIEVRQSPPSATLGTNTTADRAVETSVPAAKGKVAAYWLYAVAAAMAAIGAYLVTRTDADVAPSVTAGTTVASTTRTASAAGAASASFVPAPLLMPRGIAVQDDGALVVADRAAHRVQIIRDGNARTLAGSGDEGFADGPAAQARFDVPTDVALTADGAVIVADRLNHRIRRIAGGSVTTIAGGFEPGDDDGASADSRLRLPEAVAVAPDGRIYVADTGNGRLRIIHEGRVETVPDMTGALGAPTGLAFAPEGTLYIVDSARDQLVSWTGGHFTTVTLMGTTENRDREAIATRYNHRPAIAVDDLGRVLIADPAAHRVWQLKDGEIVPLAGSGKVGADDGYAARASFGSPEGIATANNAVYIVDASHAAVRKLSDGKVTTLVRGPAGGFADGPRSQAMLHRPWSVTSTEDGGVLVADWHNRRIRRLDGDQITTIAGSGELGDFNGHVTDAQFRAPWGIAADDAGSVYIADGENHEVRLLQSESVSTFAGSGVPGFSDGDTKTAKFRAPEDVAVSRDGVVYVADSGNHRIRSIQNGKVSTIAGSGALGHEDGAAHSSSFNYPGSVAVGSNGTLYVADTNNHVIRSIHGGRVHTLAGTGEPGFADGQQNKARFEAPVGIAVDSEGRVWVADTGNHRIRVIHQGLVRTAAGRGAPGWADGAAATSAFLLPADVAVDQRGAVWIADAGNHLLRRLHDDQVETRIGNPRR